MNNVKENFEQTSVYYAIKRNSRYFYWSTYNYYTREPKWVKSPIIACQFRTKEHAEEYLRDTIPCICGGEKVNRCRCKKDARIVVLTIQTHVKIENLE